jgi:hypothetical protein
VEVLLQALKNEGYPEYGLQRYPCCPFPMFSHRGYALLPQNAEDRPACGVRPPDVRDELRVLDR